MAAQHIEPVLKSQLGFSQNTGCKEFLPLATHLSGEVGLIPIPTTGH